MWYVYENSVWTFPIKSFCIKLFFLKKKKLALVKVYLSGIGTQGRGCVEWLAVMCVVCGYLDNYFCDCGRCELFNKGLSLNKLIYSGTSRLKQNITNVVVQLFLTIRIRSICIQCSSSFKWLKWKLWWCLTWISINNLKNIYSVFLNIQI